MKSFEYYLQKGDVKQVIIDDNFSNALLEDAIARLDYVKNETITEKNAKYLLENAYESIRTAIDAIMAKNGLKSYSHEASIVFLSKFSKKIWEYEIEKINNLRIKRNNSKYYGKYITIDEAEHAIDLAITIINKILQL